jgi:hypothetical protein
VGWGGAYSNDTKKAGPSLLFFFFIFFNGILVERKKDRMANSGLVPRIMRVQSSNMGSKNDLILYFNMNKRLYYADLSIAVVMQA